MGWASGSELMAVILKIAQKNGFGSKKRKNSYQQLIEAFEDHDCDTLDECRGIDPLFDEVLDELHPPDDYD